ncbi:MAG: archaeosortase/exosortase family protein [Pirellulaceae bacterium]|jgi:exosortase|nr:archaeosortase/exosortase family protein [Pirellulaceae bacterium]MDP7019251.1 archaeosortase/exosortase family protein [Pirellulaceae bacterium]
MFNKAYIYFALMLCLPVVVWTRDDIWISGAATDTLPVLLGLPLFFWIGGPWEWREHPPRIRGRYIALCALGMVAATMMDLTFIFAASWTLLLWFMIRSYIKEDPLRPLNRLIVIPLLSFPWIILDGQVIGWFFRLSGACVAEVILSAFEHDFARQGTQIFVRDVCVSVGEACSGLNSLQAMLIGGCVMAYAVLGQLRRFWVALPMLVLAAWVANTLRVVLTALVAVRGDAAYVSGSLHEWEGWLMLVIMFGLCAAIFATMRPQDDVARAAA